MAPFVRSGEGWQLDLIARRYGVRPSVIAGVGNDAAAVDFDRTIALQALMREHEQRQRLQGEQTETAAHSHSGDLPTLPECFDFNPTID